MPPTIPIGLIVGLVAHRVGHLSSQNAPGKRLTWSLLGAAAGMGFNVLFDPILSYLRKRFLLGLDQQIADILIKWQAATTFVNAILAVVVAVVIYNAMAPVMKKNGWI